MVLALLVLLMAGPLGAEPARIFAAECNGKGFMGAVSVQLRGKVVLEAACG